MNSPGHTDGPQLRAHLFGHRSTFQAHDRHLHFKRWPERSTLRPALPEFHMRREHPQQPFPGDHAQQTSVLQDQPMIDVLALLEP